MYECIYGIKRDIVKEVIKNSRDVTQKLKDMGMQETIEAMDELVGKDERKKSIDKDDGDDGKGRFISGSMKYIRGYLLFKMCWR